MLEEWFLTADERGNPASALPTSVEGNSVRPLVHGAEYFARLAAEVAELQTGDHLFFTDWRGDADERLGPDGPTVGEAFAAAVGRGVLVKGLMWRAHRSDVGYSENANRGLGELVRDAGGEVLLDQRVRRAGSHHQKLAVLRHPGHPERDVAFVGGIDLCHGRRDDADHAGDPQAAQLAGAYGSTPPWHDVQLELRGPVVGALDLVFRERWTDPRSLDTDNPLSWLEDRLRRVDLSADPLPDRPADPPAVGTCHVQVLRTYPAIRPRTPYAPQGERSVARGFAKALRRARRLVYVEDQYMWSPHIARLLADALRANPRLHIVVVLPRHPDVDGRLALPPNEVGRVEAIETVQRAAADRVHVFDVENREGTPVYVHAKVAVIDDVWACVGSANLNRRSWSHDSELSCAVVDAEHDTREPTDPAGLGDRARVFARDLRLTLLREHLDRPDDGGDDADLLDPDDVVRALNASADGLDRWHDGDRRGPRPPGRLRPHRPEELGWWTRSWAVPLYRTVYDPDGRPLAARLARRW
ncbi:phospholipase D family protein [Pseudonocardia humida]|uniref:Phospholipase n=1 Tax=Pseudonocardia humida TaxID=2800819 RepID=A0ABT1AC65_9PSEU|nr:phospholipase D-like domain-containing protein [Pseudonocardia humida]MCO1660513.1 phospholipase [Pseudonocardia humida]